MPPPIKPPAKPEPKKGGLVRPEDALAKAQKQKEALADECTALEEEIEELKVKYEMYFLGVEKREPNRWRDDLKKKVLRIKESFTRNAALKFRLQSLHARFLSYERMWMRSAREKEEGTYHRDVVKAKLRAKRDERQAEAPAAAPPQGALQKSAAPAQKPAPHPAAPPPKGGMSDAQLRALYDQYVAAKKSCREDVSKLTYEAVAKTVSKQLPELMTRYKAKSVEFRVEVKEGRAVLKAIPKV